MPSNPQEVDGSSREAVARDEWQLKCEPLFCINCCLASMASNSQEADGSSREAVERDERRLADLGRRCVEMFAAAHIASSHLEVRRRGIRKQAAYGCGQGLR